ncbi:uncharacterized protein LOC110098075 [Dendrobium catenatum]|uniref:uncharacterized protein LOC110098075 n=1 Tax=Dendrobium catenatum TaxID=906689 RepID=UPI00109F4393|nr:uncharacterized protein LOC110098075 [Dendrobium catenatum]
MDRYLKRKECVEVDIDNLSIDPGLQPSIWNYDVNHRDRVRRAYLVKGPYQPKNHNFPQTIIGNVARRFNSKWFEEYPSWLEYSVHKDAAFCLYYYLFKPQEQTSISQGGGDSFVGEGFKNWKRKEKLLAHVGKHNSAHNKARQKSVDLINLKLQSVPTLWLSKNDKNKKEYRILLSATVDCVRFLQKQGLSFCGHDEASDSNNKGNYLELFHFLADHNEEIKKVTSFETLASIINDIDNSYFSILVDETRDVSTKEQLALVVRYVDRKGQVIERFIGIKHVASTNAVTLKAAVEETLAKHSLSLHKIRGQGYDGASNMSGEFNGLKALILNDNPQAFYIHCFAHQLQLCLVAVTKNHWQVKHLFEFTSRIINIVGASCKRSDTMKAIQQEKLLSHLKAGNLISSRGLNQETNLQRSSDTRWSSHFHTLISLIKMYASVIEVLKIIKEEGLQVLTESGWTVLLDEVSHFCSVFEVIVPKMNETYKTRLRIVRRGEEITNLHHYHVELFYTVVDMQLQEINNRFSESCTELLLCVACLNPTDTFQVYDERKLIRLEDDEFSSLNRIADLSKQIIKFKKDDVYLLVYRLITLALTLPVSTAAVERAFSAMRIVKHRLRSRMGSAYVTHEEMSEDARNDKEGYGLWILVNYGTKKIKNHASKRFYPRLVEAAVSKESELVKEKEAEPVIATNAESIFELVMGDLDATPSQDGEISNVEEVVSFEAFEGNGGPIIVSENGGSAEVGVIKNNIKFEVVWASVLASFAMVKK